jgi:hypothetical protein
MGEHSIQCCEKTNLTNYYARNCCQICPPYTPTDHVLWFFSFPFRELDPRQGGKDTCFESIMSSNPEMAWAQFWYPHRQYVVLLDSLQFIDRLNSPTLRLPIKFRLALSGSSFQKQPWVPVPNYFLFIFLAWNLWLLSLRLIL